MRLSQRRKRHTSKPKSKTASWRSIGFLSIFLVMAFYSWNFQKNWKRRLETTKMIYKETNTANAFNARATNADISQTQSTPSTKIIRTTNVPADPKATPSSTNDKEPSSDTTTTTVTATTTNVLPLNLIPNDQLREHDYFSDSWILKRDKFLNLPRRRLGIVEDACFVAIGPGGSVYPTSKMFVDWTDFMVEHMSKWWNELRVLQDEDSTMFKKTLSHLDQYIHRVLENNPKQPTTFQETIAVVAFAPYKSAVASRGHMLTVHSLAATLASLYHVGFGRVVIAGYGPQDQQHVEGALDHLVKTATLSVIATFTASSTQIQIGHTEFGFAKVVQEDWISTQWVKFNMPRGAVIGLQEALIGNITTDTGSHGEDSVTNSAAWLGTTHDRSYWKYVYLTEPDTILHTKLELLPSIKQGLDDGLSFFPHRLQPIPHGSDLPKTKSKVVSSAHKGRYVPNHVLPFSNVTILDHPTTSNNKNLDPDPEGSVGVTAYHCCDAGKSLEHENCGTWWWTCGFHDGFDQALFSEQEALEKHARLAHYPMMRLKQGTGIVFGPTEHARKCIPSKTPCPMSSRKNDGLVK